MIVIVHMKFIQLLYYAIKMNSDSAAILYMLILRKPNNIQSLLIHWVTCLCNKSGLNLKCCSMKIKMLFHDNVLVDSICDAKLGF